MEEQFLASHRFYKRSRIKQKLFIFLIYISLAVFLIGAIILIAIFKIVWPLFILPFLMITVASFADAPSGKLSGSLIYYSPFFIATKPRKGKVILHAGTPFDYYFVFRRKDRGIKARKEVLTQFLRGMIRFIDDLPKEEITVEGTSYFFNERTARRLGFDIKPAGMDQVIILGFNFLPLMLTYSFTKGKPGFPDLNHIKKGSISSKKLVLQRDKIERLLNGIQHGGTETRGI